jgi:hypothetical protein
LLLLLLLLHSTQFDPGDPSIANDRDHAAIYLRPNTFLFRKLQTYFFFSAARLSENNRLQLKLAAS